MEEPIRKEDIFDFGGTEQSLKDLIDLLGKVSKILNSDIKAEADIIAKQVQGLNISLKENQEILSKLMPTVESLAARDKEINKLEKERIQLDARLKESTSELAQGNAKLKVEIEKVNKVNKDNARLSDSAEGSVNRMRAKLKELTAEYNRLGASARKDVAPSINKLTEELKKAESAIGNNTRNVGNYKKSILEAGKQLLVFTGLAGGATAVLGKLKEAFASTATGWEFISKVGSVSKQIFYELSEALFNWGDSYSKGSMKVKDAIDIGKQMSDLRKGDIKDITEVSRMEKNIALYRYESTNQAK